MKKTTDTNKSRLIKKELTFTLTESERDSKLAESDKLERAIEKIQNKIKDFATSQKAEMKMLTKDRNIIRRQIETNSEPRLVNCTEHLDFEAGVVTYLFKNKIMDERKMYESERQEQIPFPKSHKARSVSTKLKTTAPSSRTTVKLNSTTVPEQATA